MILKMSGFQEEMRYAKTKIGSFTRKKKLVETVPEEALVMDLLDQLN